MTAPRTFNFCEAMFSLCEDITLRISEFQHIDMDVVAVSYSQARMKTVFGLQAKLTPMRFDGGSLTEVREDQIWKVQRLFHENREMLYILTFYLPRFLNQSFSEKMTTVFHELYHVSPDFDGSLRKFEGRYHTHTKSEKEYDLLMEHFSRVYLHLNPPVELYRFLMWDFDELVEKMGTVVGVQIPIPKLIPLEQHHSA